MLTIEFDLKTCFFYSFFFCIKYRIHRDIKSYETIEMEEVEEIEIVIVGTGIYGLATSLALHRYLIFTIHYLTSFYHSISYWTYCYKLIHSEQPKKEKWNMYLCYVVLCRKGIKSVVLEKWEQPEQISQSGQMVGLLFITLVLSQTSG